MGFAADWREDPDEYEHYLDCDCADCNLQHAQYHDDLALRAFVSECLGGESPVSLAKKITHSGLKLLHWEYVARPNLVKQFTKKREMLGKAAVLGNSRRHNDEQITKMTQVRVSYHGSPRNNILSIINGGFVIPGKKNVAGETVMIRRGDTWGRGVYSSPDINVSIPYTEEDWDYREQPTSKRRIPGMKIIVCAVLLGNTFKFNSRNHGDGSASIAEGYHSHISPSGLEWIVFEESQIVPIVVLHLGDAKDPSQPDQLTSSRAPKTPRELSLASRKNLPFGFGPAGSRCVIEEIGETDEDDENWGDYQTHDQREDEYSMDALIRARKQGWVE